jgi:hypothetical protein
MAVRDDLLGSDAPVLFKHGVPSVVIHERAEIHLRCANVIESTFAAVRHRTKDHLRAGLESGRLAMAYKLTAQGAGGGHGQRISPRDARPRRKARQRKHVERGNDQQALTPLIETVACPRSIHRS